MKKGLRILIVLFLTLLPGIVLSAELYVQSIKAPLLSEPILGAKELAVAKRGEILKEVEKKGDWYKVVYKDITGWVSRLLVDTRPPSGRISVIEKTEEELQGGARRRASAFVTAAAARGLMEERARLSDRYRIDPEGVEWIESIVIKDEEALRFLEEGIRR